MSGFLVWSKRALEKVCGTEWDFAFKRLSNSVHLACRQKDWSEVLQALGLLFASRAMLSASNQFLVSKSDMSRYLLSRQSRLCLCLGVQRAEAQGGST